MTGYVLRGGDAGAKRLRLLARVHRAPTQRLLERLGLRPGMRCLDVGCGIGEVSLALARAVAPAGEVVGVDLDESYLEIAREDAAREGLPARFHRRSAMGLGEEGAYDVAYARCLVSHVPDPARVVAEIVRAVRPGGVVALEDIDFRGVFSHPHSPACDRYVGLYTEVVRRNGGDASRGADLLRLLREAGVEDTALEVALPTFIDEEAKSMAALTMEHIRAPVREAGLATDAEVDEVVRGLFALAADRGAILSMPRVFQVWGRRT